MHRCIGSPLKALTTKIGQKGRNTIQERKARTDSRRLAIITLFSEHLKRVPPQSEDPSSYPKKSPTSAPISLPFEPSLETKMERVEIRE